ncbi:hypothetical protein M1M34_gp057 [Haloarcula tailed virus 2]|uniref:Uncharacterized protein n=1 Tax=Haloarcula tailed virus 2 TaxID=2877989 RepID=A0AAE9BZI8_9CAUD|nr:hypothetical protein M1M34_gp057 [Haloarcula tailed virus 2]UBF23276.1 hypothetical protein HATV-2_gp125 [Haloarcula tailed virus 2]
MKQTIKDPQTECAMCYGTFYADETAVYAGNGFVYHVECHEA